MYDPFKNPDAAAAQSQHEVTVYHKLKILQGSVIPKFYGYLNLHGFLIIALEDCGSPLKASEYDLYKEEIQAAIHSLSLLGVTHNDLEERDEMYPNILIHTGDGRIRIIDFHMSI